MDSSLTPPTWHTNSTSTRTQVEFRRELIGTGAGAEAGYNISTSLVASPGGSGVLNAADVSIESVPPGVDPWSPGFSSATPRVGITAGSGTTAMDVWIDNVAVVCGPCPANGGPDW